VGRPDKAERMMTMKNTTTRCTLLLLLLACLSSIAVGQNLSSYVDSRIRANVKARVDQTDPTKQSSPPAAVDNSTSLVERSSAPDLLGLGLDFLNLSDASGEKKSAIPKTLSFSAYALKSALSSEDPLDPEIYNANKNWRSVSFTVGYDVPENTNTREPIIGIKWLAYNGRDVSNANNQSEIGKIQGALDSSSREFSRIYDEVRFYLFDALRARGKLPAGVSTQEDFEGPIADRTEFPKILAILTDDEKKSIDGIISKHISAFVNLDTVTKNAVKTIRTRPQLALSFTTTQRKGIRPDEYAGTLTFDKGMGTNSITLNGSFLFKKDFMGKDSKGGKFAAAIHLPLQAFRPLEYKDPLLFSLEADATGMTGESPMYRAQAKLTIPLLPGVEIPISVSVANRTELIKEQEVKGKFGFTFDVSKALKALRDNFQKR
jgi:hypothetical protein